MDDKELIRTLTSRKRAAGQRGWRCPDDTQLAAYADGQLDAAAKQQVEKHVTGCDFCLEQVAVLVRLQDAELPSEVQESLLVRARQLSPSAGSASAGPSWRWVAVAGATASVALAAALWWQEPQRPISPPRPPAAPPVERAASPSAPLGVSPARSVRNGKKPVLAPDLLWPQAGAVVSGQDVKFRWQKIEQSLFYEIRVVTAAGDLVWEGRTEAAEVRLPADVKLAAGEKYFIWVRAYLPAGKTLKSSTVGFTISENN